MPTSRLQIFIGKKEEEVDWGLNYINEINIRVSSQSVPQLMMKSKKVIPDGEQLKQKQYPATERQCILLTGTDCKPLKLNAIVAYDLKHDVPTSNHKGLSTGIHCER